MLRWTVPPSESLPRATLSGPLIGARFFENRVTLEFECERVRDHAAPLSSSRDSFPGRPVGARGVGSNKQMGNRVPAVIDGGPRGTDKPNQLN